MATLRKINERHQITIPAGVLRDAGLPSGGLYSIEAKDGKIILEPKEIGDKNLEEEDWKALESMVHRQTHSGGSTLYPNPQTAKNHFKRLNKGSARNK